nr:MAG TPA: hypothetical protein [Caudoviricetes sp.]
MQGQGLTVKKLLLSSNANNSSNASLSYFNSNNGVSNSSTNVGLLYIFSLIILFLIICLNSVLATWQKIT